jgi:hypothetical protein
MARRLTTNQEIAGSIPASINSCASLFNEQRYNPFATFWYTSGCFWIFFGVGTLWDEWEVMGERNSGGFDLLLVCC